LEEDQEGQEDQEGLVLFPKPFLIF